MIIETVLAVVATVLLVAVPVLVAPFWEDLVRNRVSVRRIASLDDPDTGTLLDLYTSLFPDDDTNYSPDEMFQYFDGSPNFGDGRHVRSENIVLVAKYQGDVVGFLLCYFYPERRKAIICYYGIKRDVLAARRSAADKLLLRLKKILLDGRHPCDYLFFDLQGVDSTTSKKEAGERKARPVRFKQSAKHLGLPAYQLLFPYTCPKVSLRDDTQEYPFTLLCIPISAALPRPVPRPLILEFLHFLYHDCYGDLYLVSDDRFQPFHDHLEECIKHYEDTLPPEIPAV